MARRPRHRSAGTFRRPARYLNDGVPDFERELALDGTTLFGSVKSALLIDVVARGSPFQERAAASARTCARGRTWVAPHDAIVGGHRHRRAHRRSHGTAGRGAASPPAAGTYHVIAISGGNIAILAGPALRPAARSRAAAAAPGRC